MNYDMKHMDHIDAIAAADTNVLRMKEKTYNGSWKKAGGRSAWFMMRRNMDRVLTMMNHVPLTIPMSSVDTTSGMITLKLSDVQASMRSEDIFAKIDEKPDGSDGTVLACIRDLRRYLLLIEAEMVARGVVKIEGGLSNDPIPKTTIKVDPAPAHEVPPVVKRGPTRQSALKKNATLTTSSDERDFIGEVALELNVSRASVLDSLKRIARQEGIGPGTPEDGGHHAVASVEQRSVFNTPWIIDQHDYCLLRDRVGAQIADAFYEQRAPGVHRLEPVVRSVQHLPRELVSVYERILSRECWALRIERLPAGLREEFPSLQCEMNMFEFDHSPEEFRFMYIRDENEGKFRLSPAYSKWGRGV